MYPFVNVQDIQNMNFSVCVDDISYFYQNRAGYACIVLKTNGAVIETRHGYAEFIVRLRQRYNYTNKDEQ